MKSLVCAFAVVGIAGMALAQNANNLKAGMPTPEFTVNRLDGSRITKRDLMNEGAFFLFFVNPRDNLSNTATEWMVRHLRNYPEMKTKVRAIVVAPTSDVKALQAEKRLNFEPFADPGGTVANLFGIRSAPAMVLIDAKGRAVKSWVGWSGDALKNMNRAIASWNGVRPAKLNLRGVPGSTQYGTPFFRSRGGNSAAGG